MRRLIEEYGIVLLYIIAGIICILVFSAVFFGDQSSISKVINNSIDSASNNELSIQYSITYVLAGGTWVDKSTVPTTYKREDRVYLPIPKKEGYLFAGWTGTRLTEAKINVVIPEGSTGNRKYTATWTKGYYRIVYNNNIDTYITEYGKLANSVNGELVRSWMTGSMSSQLVDKGKTNTTYTSIASNGFTFAGHTFQAWNTQADGNGKRYNANTTLTENLSNDNSVSWSVKDVVLYARWDLITYTIDYQSTLSNGSKADWKAVECNEKETEITYKECADTNCTTTKEVKMYVCKSDTWKEIDALPGRYTIVDTIKLNNVQSEGYISNGWYFRDPYSDEEKMEENRVSNVVKRNDEVIINGNTYASTKLSNLTFRYNNETLAYSGNYVQDYIVPGTTGNLVLYPHWKGEDYVVTFDKNLENLNINNVDISSSKENVKTDTTTLLTTISGEIKNFPTEKIVTYGEKYGYLNTPYMSKDANEPEKTYKYKFKGWSLNPTCTLVNTESDTSTNKTGSSKSLYEEVVWSTIVKTNKNHTLYACWDPITYTIKLHSNY